MHVVFGANGRAGGETARALIDGGEAVRVVLRSAEQAAGWEKKGAEVAVADIADAGAVAAALEGAAGAFLLNRRRSPAIRSSARVRSAPRLPRAQAGRGCKRPSCSRRSARSIRREPGSSPP
jgi:uncharacterized protein YbjT (DUF2867 family)